MKQGLMVVAGIVAVIAAVLMFTVFRTPEAASGPITAIPVATGNTATSSTATTTEAATTEPAAATEAVTEAATEAATQAASAGGEQIFEIVSAESEARFLIDEVLRGTPTKVVGVTDQVAAQIAVNTGNLQQTKVGTVQINVRDIATDNDFRNRAIKNVILQTDQYEFVTFTPTSIDGLPTSVSAGQAFTFKMIGDLTIKDVTKPVTFDVTVTPVSETRLEGVATTLIAYRDFNLTIPDSPAVDTVADNVTLELSFVAQPAAS